MMDKKKIKFNWDYLEHRLAEKGYSMRSYSEKRLGKSYAFLSYYKNTAKCPPPTGVLMKMKSDLELDENILFYRTDEGKAASVESLFEKKDGLEIPEESDFEIRVKSLLDEINTKLDLLLEVEEKINRIVGFLPQKPPVERAKVLLESMTATSHKCDFDDFIRRCGLDDIPRAAAEDAAKELHFEVKVTGYGNGKKRWLVMPETRVVKKEVG